WGDRPVLDERPTADRHERLARPREVVPHLVVVPDRVDGGQPEELLDRGLLAVVVVAPAELVEGPGDEVGARHVARLLARGVGVDRVPDEEEEVGANAGHRPEDRIAALDASAEAAAAEVAAPLEMDARGLVAGGRRHELALDRVPGGPERIAVARRGPEGGRPGLDGLAAALGGCRLPSCL